MNTKKVIVVDVSDWSNDTTVDFIEELALNCEDNVLLSRPILDDGIVILGFKDYNDIVEAVKVASTVYDGAVALTYFKNVELPGDTGSYENADLRVYFGKNNNTTATLVRPKKKPGRATIEKYICDAAAIEEFADKICKMDEIFLGTDEPEEQADYTTQAAPLSNEYTETLNRLFNI